LSEWRLSRKGARYKGAYGGRDSGKSHFFGELMVLLVLQTTILILILGSQKWSPPGPGRCA
jgi:hypothetical protein